MTTSTGDTGAWQRLGTALKQRRVTLDQQFRNRKAFAEATGLDYRLIYDIEESRRTNFGVATLTVIEVGYRLMPGSIARFLGGGDLEPADAAVVPAETPPDDESPSPGAVAFARAVGIDPDDPDDPFLRPVRRAIAEAIMRHGTGATGSQVFHDYPGAEVDAQLWDDPRAPRQDKDLYLAIMRADRARDEARRRNGASRIGLAAPAPRARPALAVMRT